MASAARSSSSVSTVTVRLPLLVMLLPFISIFDRSSIVTLPVTVMLSARRTESARSEFSAAVSWDSLLTSATISPLMLPTVTSSTLRSVSASSPPRLIVPLTFTLVAPMASAARSSSSVSTVTVRLPPLLVMVLPFMLIFDRSLMVTLPVTAMLSARRTESARSEFSAAVSSVSLDGAAMISPSRVLPPSSRAATLPISSGLVRLMLLERAMLCASSATAARSSSSSETVALMVLLPVLVREPAVISSIEKSMAAFSSTLITPVSTIFVTSVLLSADFSSAHVPALAMISAPSAGVRVYPFLLMFRLPST